MLNIIKQYTLLALHIDYTVEGNNIHTARIRKRIERKTNSQTNVSPCAQDNVEVVLHASLPREAMAEHLQSRAPCLFSPGLL